MNTVIDEGVEFEVVWSGAHEGQDRDLFRQIEAPIQTAPAKRRTRIDTSESRAHLLELLHERELWSTTELREHAEISETRFWKHLQTFSRHGLTVHPSRGWVMLVRVQQEAA